LAAYGSQEQHQCRDFPLLTQASAREAARAFPLRTPAHVARAVNVDYVDDARHVMTRIAEAVDAQKCICWVRNSVADAVEAWREVRAACPTAQVTLFHARCALGDRLRVEQAITDAFGPSSTGAMRVGQIVIATQVVEQSLDIDFDLMISDLAPIDLIIQRAGRLCRHLRTATGEPTASGLDQRGIPRMMVYGPTPRPDAGARWLRDKLLRTSFVYGDHGALWLTADALVRRRGWRMPEDARPLIEAVFAQDRTGEVPEAVASLQRKSAGEERAKVAQARLNQIKLDQGYRLSEGPDWWSDASTPTRLTEETTTLFLARQEEGALRPWSDDPFEPWLMSKLQVPARRLARGTDSAAVEALRPNLPGKGRWCEVLVLEQLDESTWRALGQERDGGEVEVRYGIPTGLEYDPRQDGGE
jgi:CRISPR-associated endonuclease/helicase Cas3